MATMTETTSPMSHEYHAEAGLLTGHLQRPLERKIDGGAFVSLKGDGDQHLFHHAGHYDADGLISFRSGYTRVSGSYSKKRGWLTVATAVLEGLNILDVATADRVVAQVATEHPVFDGQVPSVTFLGTRFENFRIGGNRVELELDLGICGHRPGGERPYLQDTEFLDRVERQCKEIVYAPDLRDYLRVQYDGELAHIHQLREDRAEHRKRHESNIRFTLVKGVSDTPGAKSFGNILEIPDFGIVSLAVVEIRQSWNEEFGMMTAFILNMLDVKMGSIAEGILQGANCAVDGDSSPTENKEQRQQEELQREQTIKREQQQQDSHEDRRWHEEERAADRGAYSDRPSETMDYLQERGRIREQERLGDAVSHDPRAPDESDEKFESDLDEVSPDSARSVASQETATKGLGKPRFVNVCITSGTGRRFVPTSRSLRPGGRYALQLNIGPWSRKSAVTNPVPVPTEKLPPSEHGHWLEVVAVSDDFRLELRRYDVFLPNIGASFLCNCLQGSMHRCEVSDRKPYLYIPIVAPGLRHLAAKRSVFSPSRAGLPRAGYRPARLRLAVYFQKNLVQSLLLTATVRLVQRGHTGYSFRIDYSLTSHLSDLSFLPQRDLNILTNDNADGSHKLIINGDLKSPIAFTLNDEKMGGAMAAARQTLKEISVTEYGGQLGTKLQYENRYDKNNAKSRSDFIDDLRVLAPLGWRLWATLFQTQPEVRGAISARLRNASTRPATIQVSRVVDSLLMFPWAFIYDIPLETDKSKHTLCPSLKAWDISGKSVSDRCPFEQDHPKKNVICPFGFWGFNHIIEQPPSMPPGRALPILIKRAAGHDKAQLVMGISLDLDSGITQTHKNSLQSQLGAFEVIPKNTRDEVETALGEEELEMVYFYCHGRREALPGTKATTPYIEVGRKEGIAPDDITAWQTADWNDTHWKETSPLVFINGCHTAELTPDLLVNFVDSFIGVYAAGVIGTEILLLQELASEAAEQILVTMSSKSGDGTFVGVGKAMRQMRLHFLGKGNLLGLAYTPYCSADLKLSN